MPLADRISVERRNKFFCVLFVPVLIAVLLLFSAAMADDTKSGQDRFDLVRIEIPRLKLDLPIEKVPFDEKLNTWDITSLVGAVYWLEGTPHPEYCGNTVLAAHYMEYGEPGPLFRVRDFKKGDEIYLYSDTIRYTYKVDRYQYIPDDYMEFMKNRPSSLTLFTCAGYNWDTGTWDSRTTVLADLVSIDKIEE